MGSPSLACISFLTSTTRTPDCLRVISQMQVAEAGAALGAQYLILSGAPTRSEGRARKIEGLSKIAEMISPLGLKLAYHNHDAEFEGAEPEIEELLSGTSPEQVWFLLDAGHIFRAKLDLTSFVTRHSSRLAGTHLRDFKTDHQVPLGSGEFPLQQVAGALERSNWSGWVLAEEEREDGSKPGFAAVEPARQALRQTFGL
jgi:inosose dehydratase